MLRVLALGSAALALVLGGLGLCGWLLPDVGFVGSAWDGLSGTLGSLGAESVAVALEGALLNPVGASACTGLGIVLLATGLRSRGGGEPEVELPVSGHGEPSLDRRAARKVQKQAAAAARKGLVTEAAELCMHSGLLDLAADYFEQAGELPRAAEIRHDQNRLADAAALYVKAGQHETAGTIYASHDDFANAADCYFKAGRMSVAGEMYERAEDFRRAGECYARCEFHRQAADAFERAGDHTRAAASLDEVIREESNRGGGDPGKQSELSEMVLRAGSFYEQAGDLEAAQQVLERGGQLQRAAEIAHRLEQFEKAAELFQRSGDAQRAAEALKRCGNDQAAAQILGEYHRDKGEEEEAARLLVQAADYASAGDLYRKLEDYKMAGECYERQGDPIVAAEMFRLGGDHARALDCFERMGHFDEAAECASVIGDSLRQAKLLHKAGRSLEAAKVLLGAGKEDAGIKLLQQVQEPPEAAREAAGLLGPLLAGRGKPELAVTKLEHALEGSEAGADNVGLFFALAKLREELGQLREALALYEQVLAVDFQYEDAEARMQGLRAKLQDNPMALSRPGGADRGEENDRYKIEGELGRGGMGIVYRAQDTVLDRPVALKMLPEALRDSPQAMKNFLREAKSAAKLNHPGIVTVYDAGEQDGRFYIAMEYVDGTTLKEIVRKRGALAPSGVLHVVVQMCEALEFAHKHKVVHRDIKTANTMWTKDRKAKIMDFGLAKVVEEVRNHTTLVSGTPYYMSPEQTLGKNVDHRTDIYSLGVTLFEMATGTLPFKEGNVPYHHVHTPPPNPLKVNPKLPKLLAQVIFKCLQKDPGARFQSAGEISAVIKPALARASRKS